MQTEPWKTEPDRKEWRHAGFPCLIVRSEFSKALCGYVGMPPGHPLHGKDYGDVDAEVHGGLTYSGECAGKICHVAKEGEPEHVWWLGFDCAHYGDLSPGFTDGLGRDGVYRDMEFVTREVEQLAEQFQQQIG